MTKEFADIYDDGEHVQLWKDDDGEYHIRIFCATIFIPKETVQQLMTEIQLCMQKYFEYKKGGSI